MRVVAVLGYSRSGDRTLHPICAGRVAHAERVASGARAVVLSGGRGAMPPRARPS